MVGHLFELQAPLPTCAACPATWETAIPRKMPTCAACPATWETAIPRKKTSEFPTAISWALRMFRRQPYGSQRTITPCKPT